MSGRGYRFSQRETIEREIEMKDIEKLIQYLQDRLEELDVEEDNLYDKGYQHALQKALDMAQAIQDGMV